MTSDKKKESNKINVMSHGGSIFSSPTDSFSNMPTPHQLNGHNYLQWSRFLLMFVWGRDKEHYLTGIPPPPASAYPSFKLWCVENNLVMTWLVNSTTTKIGENYLLSSTTQQIWESAKLTYSVWDNSAALTQVKFNLRALSQGDKSITEYYLALMKL